MSTPEIGTAADVLTLTEVAQLLRCSKAYACNIVGGRVSSLPPLPHMSLGRRILVRRIALEQWLEGLEVSAKRRQCPIVLKSATIDRKPRRSAVVVIRTVACRSANAGSTGRGWASGGRVRAPVTPSMSMPATTCLLPITTSIRFPISLSDWNP